MKDITNQDRAEWAYCALERFQDKTQTDDEDALADLLCDLMHLADRDGLDFDNELNRARNNHTEEVAEEEMLVPHYTMDYSDIWDTSKPYPDEPA